MNSKALFPAAFAAAALLTATPVLANQDVETGRTWGRLLKQAGVGFHQEKDCHPGTSGFYNRPTRTIHVCVNNIRSASELLQVVAHEAIHAAQHCAAISYKRPDTLMPISVFIGTEDPILGAEVAGVLRHQAMARRASGIAYSSRLNGNYTTPALEEEAYALEVNTVMSQNLFSAVCSDIR